METQSVIVRSVVAAAGRFAPGHLGELTQQVPFEMVDEALAATGKVQARVRRAVAPGADGHRCGVRERGECGAIGRHKSVWEAALEGFDCAVTALEPTGSAPAQARVGVRGEPACRPGLVPGGWMTWADTGKCRLTSG